MANKKLGQHFLQNKETIHKIIERISPLASDHIVEIGPGLGALTAKLLPLVNQLDVVEIDAELCVKLKHKFKNTYPNLIIHHSDVLKFDFQQLIDSKQQLRIIGNLPYNISTEIIFHVLGVKSLQTTTSFVVVCKDLTPSPLDMHFMVQREVANRLAAKPNSKDYGRLSIMVQYFCEVIKLIEVPPEDFFPKPKVFSTVVRLIPYKTLPHVANDFDHFAMIVKAAFGKRRKTIKNALANIISLDQLEKAGINPTLRPEQLSIQDFVELSNGVNPSS